MQTQAVALPSAGIPYPGVEFPPPVLKQQCVVPGKAPPPPLGGAGGPRTHLRHSVHPTGPTWDSDSPRTPTSRSDDPFPSIPPPLKAVQSAPWKLPLIFDNERLLVGAGVATESASHYRSKTGGGRFHVSDSGLC